jgi:hypothetical protein
MANIESAEGGVGQIKARWVAPALILCFLAAIPAFGEVGASGESRAPSGPRVRASAPLQLGGYVEASTDLVYRAADDTYLFDFPFRSAIRFSFGSEKMQAVISLEYFEGPGLGETYLLGGTERSNIKIGYYVEEWGAAYSVGLPSVLNNRDERNPYNVFYSRAYRPNPIGTMTVGGENFYLQLALSNRAAVIDSLDDTDFGVRGVAEVSTVSLFCGSIKKAGSLPLLVFAGIEQEIDEGRYWTELDWERGDGVPDIWNYTLGMSRELSTAKVTAEYLLLDTDDVLFLEENLSVASSVRFDLKSYFHLPDFSTALSGFFVVEVADGLTFEPGFYGFIGKRGRYFSPLAEGGPQGGNDNRASLRLRFEF